MSAPRTIHQLVHTLSYGDAISGEALALQRSFREMHCDSEIFAINIHPKLKGAAKDYRQLPADYQGELVLHYSLGSPLNDIYRSMGRAARSLIFHNLTASDWFKGVNPRIVRDLEQGREQLPALCSLTDRLIADSRFNAAELEELGFEADVLELPIDAEKWSVAANEGIRRVVQSEPGIHVMHVGRLAPNKCVEDVIKTFYFLHHKIDRRSRLWIVGIDIDTELYSFSLKRLVDELDLTSAVNFVGCLADSELKALYQAATVYLCLSEHEGFCLPVIEAMHFGLPVISYAASALPDTVASGGILVSEKRHPQIAELINLIYIDSAFRNKLVTAGYQRAAELSIEKFDVRVREVFAAAGRKSGSKAAQC